MIFLGYPTQELCIPLACYLGSETIRVWSVFESALRDLSQTDPDSIRQSVNSSPERLVAATEAILGYLSDDEVVDPQSLKDGEQQFNELIMVPRLLDALSWALPKAAISERIALYSGKTFLRDRHSRDDVRISLVEKCLDEYNTRVRHAKLEKLNKGIEDGERFASIWLCPTFYLTSLHM